MMARSTALQTEAGYIDARPHLPDRRNLLAPHGRTIHLGQKLTRRERHDDGIGSFRRFQRR
ncbi:hypothetical protein WN72_28570 [Bradyrhizobium arachidis]|uniref:Uncharacterized protein n=1 Tax=Bradyrhizobium arachidis TaxID=858423 RepID=A0AAE7NUL6_9BRAD|nr:hypothetical protein WN72_28570 [Bradyrhizobium arachidis]